MALIRINNQGKRLLDKSSQPATTGRGSLIRMDSQGKLVRAEKSRLIRMDSEGRLIGRERAPFARPAQRNALLLLDLSASMAENNKLPYAQHGAMRFAESALERGYHSGLIAFGSEARLIAAPTGDLHAFNDSVISTSARMLGDGTNMGHALYLAATCPDITAVVIVTDGYPNSTDDALHYAKELRKRSIDIITIGTEDADHAFLKRIATRMDLAIEIETENIQNAINDASRLLAC